MPIYSHSRLECFENCSLHFKFAYIDKIKREEQSIEAFVGSRFHEVMEKLYSDLKFKTYPLKELSDYYESLWDKEWNDDVVIKKRERIAIDYRNLGRKCIEDYYKRYYPFNQARVLGIEKEILIDLDNSGRYKVRGYIDRLTQTEDGTYEIHDYKTSGYLPDQKYFDEDRQLALYQIGIENTWNDIKNVKLIWHYVVFGKEMVSRRTQEQLESLKNNTISLIEKIENTREFLPNESSLCEWCVYPDLCPKRKHLYKVEALPVNEYLKDSGVQLVNAYAKLATQKKEHQDEIAKIEQELDKVKEVVIKYAEKEDIEVIKGSDHKLKVTKKQKVISPPKGSPERHELENILREANKWEEVSVLDIYAIEKAINEERWDKKIINKIIKFLTIEIRKYVFLLQLYDKEK